MAGGNTTSIVAQKLLDQYKTPGKFQAPPSEIPPRFTSGRKSKTALTSKLAPSVRARCPLSLPWTPWSAAVLDLGDLLGAVLPIKDGTYVKTRNVSLSHRVGGEMERHRTEWNGGNGLLVDRRFLPTSLVYLNDNIF
ncbi:uncharacterized protein [Bemisia tabaci]|uniref:uncharacterized protein n=1 Tax=Bemisia tabaci TaxID=7038 RepID=UPI003B28320C